MAPVDPEGHLKATYFDGPAAFRDWLEANHAAADVLWVGFWKRASGRPSPTWTESVEEALCFGWIDGVRRSVDDDRYAIRFTPRRPGSTWSARNLSMFEALERDGRVRPAGRAAFEARDPARTDRYSFEQERVVLDDDALRRFRAEPEAWAWFQRQPPSYRKPATWWVMSAKREETRRRRLATLIEDSAAGRRIKPLRR